MFLFWSDIFNLFAATVWDTFGRQYVTANYGIVYTAKRVAALLVPLGNVLTRVSGSWHAVYTFGCSMNVIAALLAIFVLRPVIEARLRDPREAFAATPAAAIRFAYPASRQRSSAKESAAAA